MSRPRISLGRPAHGGVRRAIPGCPGLHVESGWIRCPAFTRRERLVWLVYLRPPRRLAKILPFATPGDLR